MERADGTEGLGKAGGGAESGGLTRVGKSFACFGPVPSASPEERNGAVAGAPVRVPLWAAALLEASAEDPLPVWSSRPLLAEG